MRAGIAMLLAGLSVLLGSGGAARGQPSYEEVGAEIEKQAREWLPGTIERTRRSFALGPFLGGHIMVPTSDGGEVDGVLSFGLELLYFKVPMVLDPSAVKEILIDRAKAKLAERVKAAVMRGERPTREEIEQMGREILKETREELIGERSRLVEKPRFQLLVEGDRLFRSDAWQLRTTLGVGFSYFSVGATFAGQLGGGGGVSAGPEVGFYLLPKKKSPRSPVVQLFARWDAALHGRDERADRLDFGIKFLLDII